MHATDACITSIDGLLSMPPFGCAMSSSMEAIEFYSGIGGLSAAAAAHNIVVTQCFDIHPLANMVHKHNFHSTTSPTTITNFSLTERRGKPPQFWLLSPPCQPFSRRGKQLDLEDTRNESFLSLIKVIETGEIELLPNYILIENVAFFEQSKTRSYLVETLSNASYQVEEFLLSPTQFSIPNQRLRYFCLAKKSPLHFYKEKGAIPPTDGILRSIPGYKHTTLDECNSISSYLEPLSPEMMYEQYKIAEKIVEKKGLLFDIVTPLSKCTNCFTKSYGRFVEGSGSVIETVSISSTNSEDPEEVTKELHIRKLRYFSPREMLNLHGFPNHFSFPESVTPKQAYKLIGNSLNVVVVRELIRYLLHEP